MLRAVSYLYDMQLPAMFTQHPASVNETYAEHARCASHFAKELALAAGAAAVHAVCPSMFETTASTKIKALYGEMTSGTRGELDCEPAPARMAG